LKNKYDELQQEFASIKSELGATNILQKQLKEKDEEIKKLNAELHEVKKGSPINPHKQCDEAFAIFKQ